MDIKNIMSKKLFMAIISAILVVCNEGLNLGIPSETVIAFMGVIATYIWKQADLDKVLVEAGKK